MIRWRQLKESWTSDPGAGRVPVQAQSASSSQIGGVFRSGPVWPEPSGYQDVPAARVGQWGPCAPGSNQGLGKSLGDGFNGGNCRGSIWAVMGRFLGWFWAKMCKGTSGTISANPLQPIAQAIVRERETKRERERDRRPKEKPSGGLICSGEGLAVRDKACEVDRRQKEKEKEKEAAQGDRKRKVQTWTVVKERIREDSSHKMMCGDWVIVDRCEVLIAYCANCEILID
uniref:Uncharacterized protein n=1 Tax=Brassica campestris TaxID=3711 RepID=M4CCT6_BRACM